MSKLDRKRVFNARSVKFLTFRLPKIHEKGKKELNNCKRIYSGKSLFLPCFPVFSKSLFLSGLEFSPLSVKPGLRFTKNCLEKNLKVHIVSNLPIV